MSRPRKGPPLPAPFDQVRMRRSICNAGHVCDSTLVAWVTGSTKISDNNCQGIVAACMSLGVVPPLGAKLPAVGTESAKPNLLRALS